MVVFLIGFIPFAIITLIIFKMGNKSDFKYNRIFNILTTLLIAALFLVTGLKLEFEGAHALTKVPELYLIFNFVLSFIIIFIVGLIKYFVHSYFRRKEKSNRKN